MAAASPVKLSSGGLRLRPANSHNRQPQDMCPCTRLSKMSEMSVDKRSEPMHKNLTVTACVAPVCVCGHLDIGYL